MTTTTRDKVIRASQTQRLLQLFQEQGTVTNRELNELFFRYSARIHELRQDGHLIATERLKDGLFRFTYWGQVETDE